MYQRQEIFNIIELFTSQKLINFYTKIFDNLNLSPLPDRVPSKYGSSEFSRYALFRAFIVMKCEKFAQITDLKDFLQNNLIIAQLCGFDILKSLWVFQRFIKNLSNSYLKEIIKNQVNILKELGFIDNNFISVDATPIKANTKFNNPKCFANNKFSKKNPPSSDKHCKLGVHTANNSMNIQVLEDKPNKSKKNYEFYWGYKNHVICDAISGLPIADKGYDSLCPCKHEKYFNGKKNSGCVKYISIGTDHRASINRNSIFFKRIYRLRTESER